MRCLNILGIKIKVKKIRYRYVPIKSVKVKFTISVSCDWTSSFPGAPPTDMKAPVCTARSGPTCSTVCGGKNGDEVNDLEGGRRRMVNTFWNRHRTLAHRQTEWVGTPSGDSKGTPMKHR